MDHDTIQELLSSYIDGDLSPGERSEVDAHLAECEACREELALLELTLAALHDLPELEAPAGFTDAVMDRVEAESGADAGAEVVPITRARRRVPVWAPIALAAAACLMVGLVWVASPWKLVTGDRAAESAAPVSLAEAVQQEALDGLASEDEERSAEKSRFARREAGAEAEPAEPAADMPMEPELSLNDALADLEAAGDADQRVAAARPATPGVVTLPRDEAAAVTGGGVADGSTATADRGDAFYTRWEEDGDALASGEGESAGESRKSAEEYRAEERGERQEQKRGVEERERLDREEEAFRQIYGEDLESDESSGDAVADMGVLEEAEEESLQYDVTAGLALGPSGYDSIDDADHSDEDLDLLDVGEYEDRLASDTRSVADRDLDRTRHKSRSEADFSVEEADDEAPVAGVARSRESRRDGGRRDRGGSARKKAEQAPAEAPAAAAHEQAYAPTTESVAAPEATEAAPAGSAEWTLQTTDATVLYGLSQVCARSEGLDCRFVSPYTGPVSLNAQQNYQVIEATVPGATYDDLQIALRSLGSLLVRTEDVAMTSQGDLVVVKIIVEYLP